MAMTDVIPIDFGKEEREAARKFARLFGIVEQLDRDIIEHPVKYLESASAEISRLRNGVRAANEALLPMYDLRRADGPPTFEMVNTIRVDRKEWERMQAAVAIIKGLL